MRFWKKTISVLLIHAFILSSLPAGVLQPVLAATPDNPAAAAKEITTNPEDVIISKDYGIVKSKFAGKGDKLIVHIQDAHCNYEAQSNIAKIVESLVRNNTLSFVSVEGADGLIDTSWFKAFPDAEVRKEVANYFMKKGEITGPEFLSITTDYPIKLFGAETREYYIQNLNAFTASYPSKDETEKYLNGIKSVLNRLQNFIYNADLKAMDSKSREHESKAIQFNEYVRFLQSEAERHKINLRQYGNLFKLINVLIYEKKIDFSVTDKERSAVIDELSKALPKDALTELVNKSISFKVGKVSSSEYYEYLKSLAAKNGIELSKKYPNLSNYIIYNSVYSKIDNEKLFNDIKEVEAAIKEKLFENEDQRTLERLSRHIDTLLGLINIKLLNGEFEYFKTHKEEFAPESFTDFMKAKSIQFGLAYEAEPPGPAVAEGILKLEDFYAIAIKRDKALVDNTLEGMKKYGQRMAVLVTGGFHSEGMAKLLEKQGISYVVVCPNITKDVPTPYIQVLTNQRTSFEDILAGPQEPVKQNMLAPALLSFGMELSPKESEEFVGLKDRTEIDRAAWMKKYSLSWLRKVFQYMGQHRMAHDKDVLRDAYIMAFKRSAKAVGLDANEIISPKIFDEAFDAAYSTLTVPGILDAARISQAKADLPSEFPADRYEWAKGPNGEDLTGVEIWDKANHTIRFRQARGEWSNYGGGMSPAQMQIDGVKIEIGINIPSVEVEKISDDRMLLKNTETGKELNISVVKTTIAGVGTRFCMIGNRTYGVAGDTIVLSNLLRHDDAQDMLAWIGNQALLDLFGVRPWDVLNITVDGRSSGARPYLFDTLQEPISRIANPEFFPPNPALEDLEAARKYLADTQYNKNASLGELITRLHYTAVLSRSNISVTGDYARVIEDLIIVTRNLLEMGLSNNQTVSKAAKGIFNSISLAVVKAEHPAKPELSTPELSSGELEKLLREEPFVIEDSDKDFPRLQAVVTSLILEGKWKPYILVSIKDFSGSTYAAYVKFVEAISRKYNGNITFILSVENPRALKGDLAGAYTARRRAIDALGDDFWLNERVITEPDGGEKVRAANAGVAYEQWSKTLTTDGNSFLEDNILTGSAMWLLLPKLGKGKKGQNYKPWLASDGIIRFGDNMNLGGNPLSRIPDDLELAACGLDALVMTPGQMAFIRTRVSEKASQLNKNMDEIFEAELEEILYNTPVGVDIRANIDKRELIERGIFVVDGNGVMGGFLEKGGGEKLPIRERYVNLVSLAYKLGSGKVLENLWFILEDSRTSLDVIKRFATTRTVPPSKEEFIGRVSAVSSFQEIFQGFIYKSARPWAEQVAQALRSKKLYGISYGDGAQAADIASMENYFEMWERYVRRYKGDKEVDLDVTRDVAITYRGDKDKLKYLLRNVKIIGKGTLEIGDGVVIQGGTIAVNGTLVIPDRTKIIDSQLLGDLEFKNEAAMVLAVNFEPKKYIFYDNGKRADKLVIYGDETITTQTYLDGTTHIVRFINSFDYKGKIYKTIGGEDRWADIRDKFALYGKMYENFDNVSHMRLGDVIKTEDKWVQLVKFIFTPTLSMEELYRVNAVIDNLADEYAAKRIDYQSLVDKIADALKTMVSARFALTDQEVFQNSVNNIADIVTKPSGTWSHQDIDEFIAQSYRRRAAPQIAEALKSVTYDNVKEEPYCKALYRILASMHPAIITDVDHGPLAWDIIGAPGEEKAFFDLSLYGGYMSHGDAKIETDSFAMAWILATRAVPASTHVDFDTPIGLYGSAQGAITVTGAELTPEQKIEVNEKIKADLENGKAKFISFVAYAGGVDIYEIPSLEDAAYLLAHPGRGGDVCDHSKRRIYMSPSRLNWYNELGPAARLEFLNHEIAHINNPDWDEARVTEAAGIGLVLAAVIGEDINTKIGSVSLRDVLDKPNGAFEISMPEIIKLYGSNIKWAIDRMRKSTAGTRGLLDKEDILGGPQLNAAVITFMAQGYADYINANFPPDERGAFIGFDPRYFSKEFAWLFTRVLLANGIKVYRDINEGYSQTPVTSYMAYHLKIACGIEITSSHNPPNQNGIKSMTWYGGVDTDDVSAKIAAHMQRMYDQGLAGAGAVKIAPYDAFRITAIDAKKLYYDTYMSRLFDEKTVTMMKTAMDGGARFIFDGLYGVGGPSMEYYLDRIFSGYDWRGKIIIMNASPDPSIGGIERPDPSNPRTMEVSGVLEKLASTPGVLIAVTADMDADRIGTAVIIPEKDVARAKRYGLFVSQMEFAGSVVNIVRFTPNQIFTLISYERVLQAYERKIGTSQFSEIKKAIAEGRAPELYLLTSIPSSLLAKQMMETFGGKVILTTVGFKNLGYEAEKLDREHPDAVIVSLMEESGGANIGPFTKDSRGSGIHRDKDTIALALALFTSASELSLEKKNMLDLYVDMAEKLGGLFYYERIDAYLPNQSQAESLLEADQKIVEAAKKAFIERYRAIDHVKERGAPQSNLDDPKNIAILAELFGKRPEDITAVEERPVANTVLLIGEGNDWQHVQPVAKRFTFKDKEVIEVFHTGKSDQEGPSIAIYDAAGNFKARALLRASGTESLIKVYLEIFESQSNPHPENLYIYFTPLLRYLGLQNYSMKAQGNDYISEYMATVKAKYEISEKRVLGKEDHRVRVAIVTPRSLENYGKILKKGYEGLGSDNVTVDMLMPEENEDIDSFAAKARSGQYDIYIVQLHGAYNEKPIAFENFGGKTILLVHRPEEIIKREERGIYKRDQQSLKQLLSRVDEVVLLGSADVGNYSKFTTSRVSAVPHGFFNIDTSAAKPKDLGIAVIGSVTTWSDMRWISDVMELMGKIRSISPESKAFGYVAGNFSKYTRPATGEVINEIENLRNNPNCLILPAKEIEMAYKAQFSDLPTFKNWLYEKSGNGRRVVIVEGKFENEELTALQSSLVDFNTQMYRELLNNFAPKVEYSGTLHENPGSFIPIVFESASMSDVESEGLNMIKVGFSEGRTDFRSAATKIAELIKDPNKYNELRSKNLKAAQGLTMTDVARQYQALTKGLLMGEQQLLEAEMAAGTKAAEMLKGKTYPEAADVIKVQSAYTIDEALARRMSPVIATMAVNVGKWASDQFKDGKKTMLGWMNNSSVWIKRDEIMPPMKAFADQVKREKREGKTTDIVFIGQGGSIECIKALYGIMGKTADSPNVHMVDTVDPEVITNLKNSLPLEATRFVVISKSMTTMEVHSFYKLFYDLYKGRNIPNPAAHFTLITDEGRAEVKDGTFAVAEGVRAPFRGEVLSRGFQNVFYIEPFSGGRYSWDTAVGILPSLIMGHEVDRMLKGAKRVEEISKNPSLADIPAAQYGLFKYSMHLDGANRPTLILPDEIKLYGPWAGQLDTESLGKTPTQSSITIDHETLAEDTGVYTKKRFFVRIKMGENDTRFDANVAKLEAAGFQVLTITLPNSTPGKVSPEDIGALLKMSEFATVIAGYFMGVNPVNQPGVEEYKKAQNQYLEMPYEENPKFIVEAGNVKVDYRASIEGTGKISESRLDEVLEGLGRNDAAARYAALLWLAAKENERDYAAMMIFKRLAQNPKLKEIMDEWRYGVRDRLKIDTLGEEAPCILHAKQQGFQEGEKSGFFTIVRFAKYAGEKIQIPGSEHTFEDLIKAQAIGTLQALSNATAVNSEGEKVPANRVGVMIELKNESPEAIADFEKFIRETVSILDKLAATEKIAKLTEKPGIQPAAVGLVRAGLILLDSGDKTRGGKIPMNAGEEYIYNTYVKDDATALHQTLVGLGVNTEWTKNKRVLILYDTAIDPAVDTAHVARAGEVAVNKYMNGAIIEVRGTGKALYDAAKVQAINLAATDAIVTIAGDATLREIGAEGLKDLGKVINVQNPDNRYIPVIGLYDLALRIAYDLGDEKILECLDRIAINDPENPTPWTSADIRKGVIIILPRIRPVDMAEAVEAYRAAQAALASL